MGYRHYIGIAEKSKLEFVKDLSIVELQDCYDEDYLPARLFTKETYELGKMYDDRDIAKFRSDVFTNPDTNCHFNNSDNEFYIINKEGFEFIIDSYRKKVLAYYESILNPSKEDVLFGDQLTPEKCIQEKVRTWGENCTKFKLYPYSLKGEQISTSWTYEYAIFELVRVYKSINWETQVVTISAH